MTRQTPVFETHRMTKINAVRFIRTLLFRALHLDQWHVANDRGERFFWRRYSVATGQWETRPISGHEAESYADEHRQNIG
jgi:hypothetical protein